jgi:hypothetical protein
MLVFVDDDFGVKLFVTDFDDVATVRAMRSVSVTAVVIVADLGFVVADFLEFRVATRAASNDHSKGGDQRQFQASSEQHFDISRHGIVFDNESNQ